MKPRAPAQRSKSRIGDRQFLHRRGFACVRSGAEGFVWLSNPQGRVSDINTSADKDIDFAGVALRDFRDYCEIVCDVYDVVIRIVELSIKDTSSVLLKASSSSSTDMQANSRIFHFSDLFENHESMRFEKLNCYSNDDFKSLMDRNASSSNLMQLARQSTSEPITASHHRNTMSSNEGRAGLDENIHTLSTLTAASITSTTSPTATAATAATTITTTTVHEPMQRQPFSGKVDSFDFLEFRSLTPTNEAFDMWDAEYDNIPERRFLTGSTFTVKIVPGLGTTPPNFSRGQSRSACSYDDNENDNNEGEDEWNDGDSEYYDEDNGEFGGW